MKKILLIIFLFLIINFSVFATGTGTTIDLSVSKAELSLDDEFELEVKITSDFDFKGGEISIKGLDDFYKTTQQNLSQFTSINGITKQTQTLKIGFYPNKIGEFEIGPAIIGDTNEKIESNKVKIKVFEANLKNENKEVNKNNEADEKIINDIKGISHSIFDFNYVFLLILLVLIIFQIYYKYFMKNKVENKNYIKESKIDLKEFIIKKLKKLKKYSNKFEKNIFYEKLNLLFRKYFDYIGITDSYTKTYIELSENVENKKLLELFKESYFNEFNNSKDEFEERDNLIQNFIKEIN